MPAVGNPLGVKVRSSTSGWQLSAPWTAPVLAPDTAVTEPLRERRKRSQGERAGGIAGGGAGKAAADGGGGSDWKALRSKSVTTDPLLGPPGSA